MLLLSGEIHRSPANWNRTPVFAHFRFISLLCLETNAGLLACSIAFDKESCANICGRFVCVVLRFRRPLGNENCANICGRVFHDWCCICHKWCPMTPVAIFITQSSGGISREIVEYWTILCLPGRLRKLFRYFAKNILTYFHNKQVCCQCQLEDLVPLPLEGVLAIRGGRQIVLSIFFKMVWNWFVRFRVSERRGKVNCVPKCSSKNYYSKFCSYRRVIHPYLPYNISLLAI